MRMMEGKSVSRIITCGKMFDCTATPYPWVHGLGVRVDVSTAGRRVGTVLVLCAFSHAEFDTLAALSPPDICDLALSRFTSGELPATLESILSWQGSIASLGYDDCISPVVSSFSRGEALADGCKGAQSKCWSHILLNRSNWGRRESR